jgi:DegV family protein with EDD domain
MKIRVVTDSTADLPPQLADEWGITVVPAYVCFGGNSYRDRVDISESEFYQRLATGPVYPSTAPPTPQDFATVYERLLCATDAVISIHISSKLSATVNSALRGKELLGKDHQIAVVDSQLVTMGLGLLAIKASHMAVSGMNLPQMVRAVENAIPDIQMLGYLDTLKYLARGNRIGKARAWLGSLLNVKPMLTIRNGELEPAGQARSQANGIEKLVAFAENFADIEELAIVFSTTPNEAQSMADRLNRVVARGKIRVARLGPVLGVHAGPGILFVAFRNRHA